MYQPIKHLVKAEEKIREACESVCAAGDFSLISAGDVRQPASSRDTAEMHVRGEYRKKLDNLHKRLHEIRSEIMTLAEEGGRL